MKHALTLACSIVTTTLAAQCTYTNLGYSGDVHYRWCDGHLLNDGTMLGVLSVSDQGQFGGMMAVWLAADGSVTQSEYMHTVNPLVRLHPMEVLPTPSGGMIIIGHRTHPLAIENYFAVELNAAGDLVWAKILMEPAGYYASDDMAWQLRIAPLPSGGYAVLFPNGDGIHRVELDQTGTPVGHKRYRHPSAYTYAYYTASAQTLVADGSGLYAAVSMDGDTLPTDSTVIVHTGADGTPDWAFVVDTASFMPWNIKTTADGGYLLLGSYGNYYWDGVNDGATVLKLDAAGTPLWKKSYGDFGRFADAVELSNGDLAFTFGFHTSGWDSIPDSLAFVRTTSTGDVLGAYAWTQNEPYGMDYNYWATLLAYMEKGTGVVGMRGDSIVLAATVQSDGPDSWVPALVIAEDFDALGCGMEPVTIASASHPVITPMPFTPDVISDTARVWDMAIGETVGMNELELVSYLSAGAARPGFNTSIWPHVENWGGLVSGPVTTTLTYDPALTYIYAAPEPTTIAGNTLTWTTTYPLEQLQTIGQYVQFNVPVSVPLGTDLVSTVTHSQANTELSLTNNTYTVHQIVTGSYDPNDKLVWPRDLYHIENDSVLDYTIQFQNTGTDTAFTVVVVDTLPLDLDVTTLRFGASSHPFTYELTGTGILRMTFNHILLPDSNTNEPLSHGLVNFRIKPILPLTLGQEITNTADIYFDFNAPIHTPDATVIVTDQTGVRPVAVPEKLNVFPVPVKHMLTAMLPAGFAPVQAFATGADGRRVPLFKPNTLERKSEYDVQHLAPGGYVLTLVDRTGKRMSARFTKE